MKTVLSRRWLLLLAALLLVGYAARGLLAGKPVATVTVSPQALTETVVSSGRVITPERIEVGAELVGKLTQVLVQDGDHVRAGQILARLDDDEQRAALEQARRAEDEAQASLVRLRQVGRPVAEQGLLEAQANQYQAEAEFERTRKLAAAGFYDQSRLDEARRAADAARAAREAARVQALSNRPDGIETRLAAARLAQARAARELAAAKLANTVIRAPVDSLVVLKLAEAGDIVTQGKRLFELAADGETQVVLQIDEKNLGRLAVGQHAGVVADAYPGRAFEAVVFHIAPAVDPAKGSVEVKLRVPEPPAFLRPDMTVSAEIRVGHRDRALTLPVAAVRDAATAQPWVMVVESGRAARRPVTLGVRGVDRVEVAAGLRDGDVVVLPTAGVSPGDRVRPAA